VSIIGPPPGQPGPEGPPGVGGGTYEHHQTVASQSWVCDHNLGYRPSVTVQDSAGTLVEGDVTYDTADQLTITFTAPFSGVAYLS
jgi:hypothetical protein